MPTTLPHLTHEHHYVAVRDAKLKAALLWLGYGVAPVRDGNGWLVVNLTADADFNLNLAALTHELPAGPTDLGEVGRMETYERQGINARVVISSWARQVLGQAGLLR